MTSAAERVWDLYNLQRSLKDQLQDVEVMLRQAMSDAYEEGVRTLPSGYTIRRSEVRDISIRTLREKHPEIYASALAKKVAEYEPELTKTDLRDWMRDQGLSEEERAALMDEIAVPSKSYRFAVYKPADPHQREVSE